MMKARVIQGHPCCTGVWGHDEWCSEEKPPRQFDTGDRVKDTNTKSKGIVIHISYVKNEGGIEPRCLVEWHEDNSHELVDFKQQSWIVEGNLILTPPIGEIKTNH